jgi:hypothetical protein
MNATSGSAAREGTTNYPLRKAGSNGFVQFG